MFLYGGAFGNPNLHAHIDLPLTLVGGPAGRPGGGQHQVEPSNDYLVERGASLEGVVNSRGWTPLRIADGVALDGIAFVRYPEAAAHLRALMHEKGFPAPPVEWDGPRETAR